MAWPGLPDVAQYKPSIKRTYVTYTFIVACKEIYDVRLQIKKHTKNYYVFKIMSSGMLALFKEHFKHFPYYHTYVLTYMENSFEQPLIIINFLKNLTYDEREPRSFAFRDAHLEDTERL